MPLNHMFQSIPNTIRNISDRLMKIDAEFVKNIEGREKNKAIYHYDFSHG